MAFKDVLLTLASYPEPTPVSVIDDAVSVAATLGAHLAAISCEVHAEVRASLLGDVILDIPALIAREAAKSRENAKALLAAFEASADKSGVRRETIFEHCATASEAALLVDYARLRDLTIMAVPDSHDLGYAEEVIFESGRPTLILPTGPRSRPLRLDAICVAWDFSRTAARAVSDALPLLESARSVRVVTVTNEKPLDSRHSGRELAKNLARHGIEVVLDEIDAESKPIDEVLTSYVLSHGIDVLVMGAYGTPRWREFVLGGATRGLLSKPPVPILFSH
ncbi:universal stress protein [Bradyrhizobium yuanmingense]|uniref:universal stress protein n=1 Tax=Bradyrhizobium yuanmingense TaxID=108015 RepID=UPI001CD52AE5|nr:universal stress protein [Bradyrhizobium yuanmingense]MCA1528916.1 universal stress protein [Bradyrhizobium yuanmingense]